MKRSVLILLSIISCSLTASVKANPSMLSRPVSSEGALTNTLEGPIDENWCLQNPDECQFRRDREREYAIQRQQRQEREAYCERNPERCENIIDQRERSKYCQRYPWKCKD